MIRVICLNPVIDRMYYIDDFHVAEKFYEIDPLVYPGGKGVNIARVMSQMDVYCVLYGFFGGQNGRMIIENMETCHVECRPFWTSGETRTTINIIDNKNRKETEITEPGVQIGGQEEESFLQILRADIKKGDFVICSGIPMRGMSEDIYYKISVFCSEVGGHCLLDTTGAYLKNSFPGTYYFSKPNFNELSELFSFSGNEDIDNLYTYGKKMVQMGVENLLISTGETGGFFMNKEEAFQAKIPWKPVVSTIGSGDASVAGFCIGAYKGLSTRESVKLAMACGINNAMNHKVGCVEKSAVEKLYQEIITVPYVPTGCA